MTTIEDATDPAILRRVEHDPTGDRNLVEPIAAAAARLYTG